MADEERVIGYLYRTIPGLEAAESVGEARSILQDDDTPKVVLITTAKALLGDPVLNSLEPYRDMFQGETDYFEDEYAQRQGELMRALEDGRRHTLSNAVDGISWFENARFQLAAWLADKDLPPIHPSLVQEDLVYNRLLALEQQVKHLERRVQELE